MTVRIKTEAAQAAHAPETFVTDDIAFGIWRYREDMTDVPAYVRQQRATRYASDGACHDEMELLQGLRNKSMENI